MAKKKGKFKTAVESGNLTPRQKKRQKFLAQGGGGKKKGGGGKKKGPFSKSPPNIRKKLAREAQVEEYESKKQIDYQNPTTYTPFGSQTVTYDENGNPVVTQALSPEQQAILGQGQKLTSMGQGFAEDQLSQYSAFGMSPDQLEGMRGKIEGDVFDRMTRGVAEQEAQEKQNFEQEMYNRGITFSDDPESQYQRRLTAHNRKFDDIRESARQQATAMSGQEMQRQFGMGLQGHQQGMADIGSLQQQGTGLMLPQFQGYQGPNFELTSPTDIWATKKGFDQQAQQLGIAQQNADTARAAQEAAARAAEKRNQDPGPDFI